MVLGNPKTAGIDGVSKGIISNPGGGDNGVTGDTGTNTFGATTTGPETEVL